MPGELLSKKLTRGERGDVSLSGPRYSAAGDPRGEHGNTAYSFGKFTSNEPPLHAVSCLPWRPLSTRSPALVDAQPRLRLVLVHFTWAQSAVVFLSLNASSL